MVSNLTASLDLHNVILAAGPLAGGWLWSIVIGFFAGLLAKLIVGGKEPAGCIITILIGIVGSLVAMYGGRALGLYQEGQAPGFLASIIGAIILLVIYHLIIGRGGRGGTGPTV